MGRLPNVAIPLDSAGWISGSVCEWDCYSNPGPISLESLLLVKAALHDGHDVLVGDAATYARVVKNGISTSTDPQNTKAAPIAHCVSLNDSTPDAHRRINTNRTIYIARTDYARITSRTFNRVRIDGPNTACESRLPTQLQVRSTQVGLPMVALFAPLSKSVIYLAFGRSLRQYPKLDTLSECVIALFTTHAAGITPTGLFSAAVSAPGHIWLLVTPSITPFPRSDWICIWIGVWFILVPRYGEAIYEWRVLLSRLIRRTAIALHVEVFIDTMVNPCSPISESEDISSAGSGRHSSEMLESSTPAPRDESVLSEIKEDREGDLISHDEEDMPAGRVYLSIF